MARLPNFPPKSPEPDLIRAKPCMECKHYKRSFGWFTEDRHLCHNPRSLPRMVDVVLGQQVIGPVPSCYDLRSHPGVNRCGPAGNFFEAKD